MSEHTDDLATALDEIRRQDRAARDEQVADKIDQSERLAATLQHPADLPGHDPVPTEDPEPPEAGTISAPSLRRESE